MQQLCPPHHWLLETPTGPTVKGVCKKCGDVREYDASGAYMHWPAQINHDAAPSIYIEGRRI